jgi:hypothetical protein
MPARQQINDDNLQHPRPVRPALRFNKNLAIAQLDPEAGVTAQDIK